MLDFILDLDRVLKIWPDNTKWNVLQIAAHAKAEPPQVVEFMAESLGKQVDVHDPLSFAEVSRAHAIMMDRKHGEFELRRLREQKIIEKAVDTFNATMEKVRIMSLTKNWRGAYRTLSYFIGSADMRLPQDVMVKACDEALRLGAKAGINFQELSQWFSRGVTALTGCPTAESVADALDFMDAYGDHFLSSSPAGGEQYLTNHLLMLKPRAMEFDLMPRLNEVASELGITSVIDVVI